MTAPLSDFPDEYRGLFSETLEREMRSIQLDIRRAVDNQVWGGDFWERSDLNTWPKFVLFPRVDRAQKWYYARKNQWRWFKERASDAWGVLKDGLPDYYEDY